MKKKFSVHAAREVEQIGKDFVVKAWEDMGVVELDDELNDTESAFDAVKDNGWFEDGVKSEDIEIAADDDHNLYIDEAETGIPMIELRIVVESKMSSKMTAEEAEEVIEELDKFLEKYGTTHAELNEKLSMGKSVDLMKKSNRIIEDSENPKEAAEKIYNMIIADSGVLDMLEEGIKDEKVEAKSALKVAAELLKVKASETVIYKMTLEDYITAVDNGEIDQVKALDDIKDLDVDLADEVTIYSDGEKMFADIAKDGRGLGYGKLQDEITSMDKKYLTEEKIEAKTKTEGDMKGTLEDIKAKANGEKFDAAINKEKQAEELAESFINGNISDVRNTIKNNAKLYNAVLEKLEEFGQDTESFRRLMLKASLNVKANELLTDRFGTPEVGSAPANDEDEIIPKGQEPEAKPAETPAAEPKPETAPAEPKTPEAPKVGEVNVEIPGEKGMATIVNLQKALNEAQKQKEISAEVIQQLNKIMKDAGLSTQGMRKYVDAVAPMAVKAMKVTAKAKEDAGKTIINAETYYNSHIANFEVSDLCGEKTKARAKELKAIIATRLEQATDGVESVLNGKSTNEGMAITASLDVVAKAMKEWQAFEESHGEYAESMRKVEASINAMQELQDNNALKPDNFANQFKDWFGYTDKERMSIKAYAINSAQASSGLSAAKLPISMETPVENMQKIRNQVLAGKNIDLTEMTIALERQEGRIPCEPEHKVTEV